MIALLVRQVRAAPWPTLLLAFTVALASLLATVTPRLSSDLDDRQLAQRLGSLSAIQGDVSGSFAPRWGSFPEAAVDPWPGIREAAEATRAGAPEPLRSLLQPPQFVASLTVVPSVSLDPHWLPEPGSSYYRISARLLVDPDLAEHVELLAGEWPQPPATDLDAPHEVAASEAFAERAGLEVGSRPTPGLVVTAIYRPADPQDTRWQHNPYGSSVAELSDPNAGVELLGGLLLAPELAGGDPTMRIQTAFRFSVYYGLDVSRIASGGVDVAELSAQLTGLLARTSPTSTDDLLGQPTDMTLHSELNVALAEVLSQQRATRTLIAVSAVGPLGVAAALVLLGAQLVLHRRRRAVALLSARGMSLRQLRQLAAVEGAIAGLPAALLGQLVAQALLPGPVPWWSWLVSVLVGLLPAAALAWVVREGPQAGRAELAAGNGRWRLAAEVLLALGAAAATWRLLATGPAAGPGIDLLAAAAPVLLALLACLLVLRIYPLPLRLLGRWLQRGRGLTGFLGAARALREPAGGVVPVLTIVLGTTMAVLGATLLGTITVGTERAAWAETGSTLHASGPQLTAETLAALRGIDGVTAVAPVARGADNRELTVGSTTVHARVWLATPDLAAAYAVSRDGSPLPTGLFEATAPVPVVVGGPDAPGPGRGQLAGVGEVVVMDHLDLLPGVTDGAVWVLVAADNWPDEAPPATTVLIATTAAADPEAVTAAVAEVLPHAKLTGMRAELDALRDTPTSAGLANIFLLLAACTAALLVVAIFTAQTMAAGQRRATAAVLRTLGLRPGQLRALTAWELGPVVVVSLLIAVAVGIGLAALMLATADLSPLTGGRAVTILHVDPLGVGGVVAGLLAASALAVLVSAWLAGRTDVASELREGENR